MRQVNLPHYYIDELGFYRPIDGSPKQQHEQQLHLKQRQDQRRPQQESGEEFNCRRELGISHFDRTVGYEAWKVDWDKFMLNKLTKKEPVTLNRELKKRIRAGIPHDYRCKVWSALIRMRTRRIRQQVGEDIYGHIVRDLVSLIEVPDYMRINSDSEELTVVPPDASPTRAPSEPSEVRRVAATSSEGFQTSLVNGNSLHKIFQINQPFLDKCFRQIELDLLRTMPNNSHFNTPDSRGIHRVRRILRAYACFNPSIGYCQGMNRLAAMAALILPEEEAFWCMVTIIQCIMPKHYYLKPWLAQVDCNVLCELLANKMPKLHRHLVDNDIHLTLFTWFFTIFVDGFRPELLLRIWDCFLLEGDKVLFRFALSILYISQEKLLEMNDFSSMSMHLSNLVSRADLDIEHLFDIAFNKMNPLSDRTLQIKRDLHSSRLREKLDES